MLADKLAGGQVEDLAAFDGRVEAPVKIFQWLQVAEGGGLFAPLQQALSPDVEFVLQEQFQELSVRQLVGGGFLHPQVQAGSQTGEPKLATGFFEVRSHWVLLWMNRPYSARLRIKGWLWAKDRCVCTSRWRCSNSARTSPRRQAPRERALAQASLTVLK